MKFWYQVITITKKDVFTEIRTKETVFSVLAFTLLAIIIFNFAFGADLVRTGLAAPAILWVTFAFAGVLSLNHSFIQEKEDDCLQSLMACPISREVIYVGKMLSSLIFMLIVELIALAVFALLFNISVFSLQLIAITLLATIGFVAVGTLFSALAVNTRAREMVLPVLFLPIVVPIIISAVKATGLARSGKPWGELSSWLQIIGAFDIIFLVVSYLVFAYVIEE